MKRIFKKALAYLRREGFKATFKRAIFYLKIYLGFSNTKAGAFTIDTRRREAEITKVFPKKITFSIIVPLYNTHKKFLHEMIKSVKAQTYFNWQLCLADGSDEKHAHVGEICKSYTDSRILYKKLSKNGGISYNTNEAIEMSSGEYIAMLDHDDILHPSALYEVMKTICEKDADLIYTDEAIFRKKPSNAVALYYKQDYAPDTLRSQNYMTHFCVYSRELLNGVGLYSRRFDGSQDYDMVLRLAEKAKNIVHIPEILYYWRAHKQSVAGDIASKQYAIDAAKDAISEHLRRTGLVGNVINSEIPGMYRTQYDITGEPLISIIIPNKDCLKYLKKCIASILTASSYRNFEVIIVENNSENPETFEYYKSVADPRVKIVTFNEAFNFSAICNFGAENSAGEILLFLNNDTEVITGNWLEEMLMFAQRKDVGAVGAKLYYPDETIQHAGVVLGIAGFAGHSHRHFGRGSLGHMGRLKIAQNMSAVTGACLMTRRDVFNEMNGFDEKLAVALNDVDLCMRILKKYLVVFTPFCELYHYESKSRGYEDTPEKEARFKREKDFFTERWAVELKTGDPYYNRNLTLDREDFSGR